jgi:hypothetical protein
MLTLVLAIMFSQVPPTVVHVPARAAHIAKPSFHHYVMADRYGRRWTGTDPVALRAHVATVIVPPVVYANCPCSIPGCHCAIGHCACHVGTYAPTWRANAPGACVTGNCPRR